MKLMNICRELIMEAYSGDSSITEYYVRFEASDYSEILYKGIDKVRAMAAFDGFDDVLTYYDDYMYVVMEGVVSHYKFIEDDDIKDYPIDEYYDDDTVYKLISTEEPETIERRKVKPPNRDSDEVLDGVQNYFQMRYGKRKYIKINIGEIQIRLRISDHTENIRNVDKGGYVDYHISVVIADMDKTVGIFGNRNKRERRNNEFELRYDSGDKVADIILSINNFIKELVKNHNLMEGRYNKTTIREYLNENQIAQIVNTGLSVSDKIEGGFLTSKQAEELQKEIESHYTDGDATKLFGQSNNDIRQSMYNYDHPYATKNVNGVELRIGEGLIEGTPFSGNRRPTYLLYADGKIVGKFYKINDIKKVVKYIEDNLVQGHNLIEGKYYLNEVEDISAESFDDKIWYHGSDKPVRKFSFSLIGVDNKKITNYHGYGIYFIDKIERAKRYGDVITLASIDKNSDFLVGRITPKQLIKIYKQLKIENVKLRDNDEDWFTNPTYGEYSVLTDVEEFYDFFMRVYKDSFKNIKDVTEFLLRSGIDGMQVTNDVGDNILVVFNEDVIKIEDNLVQGHNLIEGRFMDKYSVGDIIVSDGNEPYTGGNVFPKKGKEYQLVQKDLKDFDYSRQDLYDNDPGYEDEQDSYLENLKKNFNSTPPIPEEGDGLHRIVAAKELGYDTILMWVEL